MVAGVIVYSSGQVQGQWASQFVSQNGVKPFPPPYMEVKDADGNWVRVPDNRQFPLAEVTPESFVVDLTGLFPTSDYSLRINTFFDTRFDYIGVDTTPQQNIIIHTSILLGPISLRYSQQIPLPQATLQDTAMSLSWCVKQTMNS